MPGIDEKHVNIADARLLYNDLRERAESVVEVSATEPTSENNKLWIDNTGSATGVQVATYAELTDLKNANSAMSTATASAIGKALSPKTVTDGKVTEWQFKPIEGGGSGADLFYVTPEDFGAVGDGETDDSQAVQDACDAGYAVYFASNKTYYLASTVTINHDCHLFGGENATIKTKTPTGGTVNNGIVVEGTLKKTTTLTSNYSATDATIANSMNRFKLTDMTDINIGDIIVITAEDQFYSYNRQYYYLGATLLVAETDDDYLYTADSMPWDITNTENVSVKVYDAPMAIIENLHFESDLQTVGSYKNLVMLYYCKNSIIKNCFITDMDNGFRAYQCVNTLIDGVSVAKTPERVGQSDHYGIALLSCNNTIVSRVVSECGNSCVDLSGRIPNMNTYVRNCSIIGSNGHEGLGMHENAYNTVVEDCVLGGMLAYGTVTVKRCRFIQRNKVSDSDVFIAFRGSHRAEFSRLFVSDCVFEGPGLIGIIAHHPQSPIQAYNHIIDEVVIRDCTGGEFNITVETSETILSNTINRIILDNWQNCDEIFRTNNHVIGCFLVNNCSFSHLYWMNNHNDVFFNNGIRFLQKTTAYPQENKIYVDETHGGQFYMKDGTDIAFASNNQTDQYVVCGKNIMSNKVADYAVGSVLGSVGNAISRSVITLFNNSLSVNASNELVFTQPSNSSANAAIYPISMMYVKSAKRLYASCKLKNTGSTEGTTWKMTIAVIDAKTGLVSYRGAGTGQTATQDGVALTHDRSIRDDSIVFVYLYCTGVVQSSETTFSDFIAELMPLDELHTLVFEPYDGSSRVGDGTLKSVDGLNNIGASTLSAISVKSKCNLL